MFLKPQSPCKHHASNRLLSLQIGAYSADKAIKHLMFSCDILSFFFKKKPMFISLLVKVKNGTRHLGLH